MVGKVKNFFQNVSWKLKQWKLAAGKWIAQVLEKAHLGFLLRMPNWVKAIVALLPALIILGVFTFYPIINSFLISFYRGYNSFTGEIDGYTFLGNYKVVLEEAGFRQAVLNTALIVFVSVPISILIGLGIAVALNSIKPLQKIFQTIFFIPYVTNVLAIGMVFSLMFSHSHTVGIMPEGLINSLFGLNIDWVGITATRASWMSVVLIYTIWNGLAFKILVFIGGLQNISKQYYDAAKVDSATPYKTLTKITIPLLSPIISYILITSFIGAFKSYESVLSVAGSGSGMGLDRNRFTIVAYVYDKIGLSGLDLNGVSYYSRGAAAAVVLFLIILVFTFINLQVSKRRVHY